MCYVLPRKKKNGQYSIDLDLRKMGSIWSFYEQGLTSNFGQRSSAEEIKKPIEKKSSLLLQKSLHYMLGHTLQMMAYAFDKLRSLVI